MYTLNITDRGSILVFSLLGYTSVEEPVGGRMIVNISLSEDVDLIDEVVVVGYGTQKKVSISGAISSIPVQELEAAATPSLSVALGGRIPGIITQQESGEPGFDQAAIRIRGMASWVSSSPLVLIDGIERDMNAINTSEIESMQILKDASATAVYGVRGANGVIIITTKKGKIGKPVINLRSEMAVLTPLRLPDYINGPEYANLINEAMRNNGEATLRFSDEDIALFEDGSDPYLHPNVNWIDEILRDHTYQTMHNLNISGGTDLITYFANVGYTFQNGLYKGDNRNEYNTNANLNRYNFRSRVDINLAKNFKVFLGVGGIIQQRNYPANPVDQIFGIMQSTSPIAYPVRNPDGSPGSVPPDGISGLNPWAVATQSGYWTQHHNTVQSTFGASWDLSSLVTQGLSLNGKFSYDASTAGGPVRSKLFEVKQYIGKDPETGEDQYLIHREQSPLGFDPAGMGSSRAIYFEGTLNYDRTFGKHTVGAMAMYNQSEYVDITARTTIDNLPSRHQGFAGRFTYDYANRYFAEFNFGYNGSENFPKGKRFGFFPSVSAGWLVSNENFWNVDAVSNFKIRGSFGQAGNDQSGRRFLFLTAMKSTGLLNWYYYGMDMNQIVGIEEAQTGNEDVTWEVSTKANIGIDLGFWDGRITLQADYFREHREGILIQRQDIPTMPGFFGAQPFGNLGEARNEGVDTQLEIRNTTPGGLYYSFNANVTYARNTVIENDEPIQKYPYLSQKGLPINQTFGLIAKGFFQDQQDVDTSPRQTFASVVRPGDIKYQDINGDGVIDLYDRVPIGYPRVPELMFGFGGTVSWKGFDVSIYFTGAARSSFFIGESTMQPFYNGENNIMREYFDNRWIPNADNSNAKYPMVINTKNENNFIPGVTSTLWMRSASYLRLKNAEIGYILPQSLTSKIRMQEVRIFVNGLNLATWDKIKITDPESNRADRGYPLQRTINMGIQLTF